MKSDVRSAVALIASWRNHDSNKGRGYLDRQELVNPKLSAFSMKSDCLRDSRRSGRRGIPSSANDRAPCAYSIVANKGDGSL